MITIQSSWPAIVTDKAFHEETLKKFQSTINRTDIGFFHHTKDKSVATLAKTTARKFNHKKMLVHVGIGGSSLGPEMLVSALGIAAGKSVMFLNNIDSDMIARQQKSWIKDETFFYVVSKSGGTAETLAALTIIIDWLTKNGCKPDQWKEHIVLCTDPQKGDLRQLAREYHLDCLDVPIQIGGRYSVLSDVGLFTAAWCGINVDQLIVGAESIKQQLLETDPEKNILTTLTYWLYQRYLEKIELTVLMPYSSLLKDFTSWWVQLWAESLGKNNKGLTPIMAYGASDQHSQMQLFMEGPNNKAVIFIQSKKSRVHFSLDNQLKQKNFSQLNSFNLHQLMEAEYSGTLKAFLESKRAFIDLAVPEVSSENLGKLILLFESLTVATAGFLEVDPFNQPGVEAAKKNAHDWLSNHRK